MCSSAFRVTNCPSFSYVCGVWNSAVPRENFMTQLNLFPTTNRDRLLYLRKLVSVVNSAISEDVPCCDSDLVRRKEITIIVH